MPDDSSIDLPLQLYDLCLTKVKQRMLNLYYDSSYIIENIYLEMLDKKQLCIKNGTDIVIKLSQNNVENLQNKMTNMLSEDLLVKSTFIFSKAKNNNVKLSYFLYLKNIKCIKLRLLELYPSATGLIEDVYTELYNVYQSYDLNENKLVIKLYPKIKAMLMNNVNIVANALTLKNKWITILGAVLNTKENLCKEFWNNQCKEYSKKLWFPSDDTNDTDFKKDKVAWFKINDQVNTKYTKSLFKYNQKIEEPDEEKVLIRAIKVRLLPTLMQSKQLDKWSNTCRFVYNKCLDHIKNDIAINGKSDYKKTRTECITANSRNDIANTGLLVEDWELETPKDIRDGALRDIKAAYKAAWSNLNNGNIKSFGLNHRLKKDYTQQSIIIPSSAIKLDKTHNKLNGLTIFESYWKMSVADRNVLIKQQRLTSTKSKAVLTEEHKLKEYNNSLIKVDKIGQKILKKINISRETRLKKENNEWFLCILYDATKQVSQVQTKLCALDPGVRKFQTIYSEEKVTTIVPHDSLIEKLYKRLDGLQTLRKKYTISQQSYNKKRCRIQSKLNCLVDDMHYKTISFLVKNYTSILLPSFESQEMVRSRKLNKSTKRKMMIYSFYKFQQRLIHKCSLSTNTSVTIVNEAYTSQTCGYCGNLKKTSAEIIHCKKCDNIFDRDINGSRNIYLKYVDLLN